MALPAYGTTDFGTTKVTLARAGLSFDGSAGQVWEELWVGTSAGIALKYSAVVAVGGKAVKADDQGVSTLTVTYARDPNEPESAEVPSEEWEMDTETEGVDLFATSTAEQEAAGYVSRALYRKDIKDAVDEGEAFPLSEANYPVGAQIYSLLSRGVTSIPFNRPVLTRQRTFSAAYTGRAKPTARQSIWTTSELVAAFAIPVAVQARLPDDPPSSDTPVGTLWAWKLTVDNARFSPSTGKWVETKAWSFAAWVESFFVRNPSL